MGEIVLQGARKAVGDPHFISDHTAAGFDELVERAHRGTLRLERLELVAMGEEEFETDGNGLTAEPCTQRADPRLDGLGRVLEREALAFCGARSLETHIMFGI